MHVVQACQPAAMSLGNMRKLPAQYLHKKQLRQAPEQRKVSGAGLRRFFDQPIDRDLPPSGLMPERDDLCHARIVVSSLYDHVSVANTNTQKRGHCLEQWAEPLVGMEIAADEGSFLASSTVLQSRDLIRQPLSVDLPYRYRCQPQIAGHYVLIAASHYNDITCLEHHRRKLAARQPTTAARRNVKWRDRFRTGFEASRKHIRRG